MFNSSFFQATSNSHFTFQDNALVISANPPQRPIPVLIPIEVNPEIRNYLEMSNNHSFSFDVNQILGEILLQKHWENRKRITEQQRTAVENYIHPNPSQLKEELREGKLSSNVQLGCLAQIQGTNG